MKDPMTYIERFCYRHPNFGVKKLMLYVTAANVAFWLLGAINPVLLSYLSFDAAAILRGQSTGVVFCLAARLQQAVAKTLGVAGGLELFRFQHKVVALVAVNAPSAGAAIAMLEGDGPLEHVVLRGRGVGLVHAQQGAQVDDKTLRGRQFTGRYALPTGNKSRGLCGCGNGGGGWFGGRDRHGQR